MEGSCAGLWEFPGGKLEDGETDEAALVREFDEEFGAAIEPVELVCETTFSYGGRTRALAAWHCRLVGEGPLELREHLELRYCLPEEIGRLDLVDSDRKLLGLVREWLARQA